MTKLQESELLRIYLAMPKTPPAETLGQKATRRVLEKAGLLLCADSSWELTPAGRAKARELAAKEQA